MLDSIDIVRDIYQVIAELQKSKTEVRKMYSPFYMVLTMFNKTLVCITYIVLVGQGLAGELHLIH